MSGIRVLLVDDHAVLRDGLRAFLDLQPNIRVVGEAVDGYDALAKVEELQPDVVVMDVAMPRMNGIEATFRIRQNWPLCRVLILTQHDRKEYIQQLLKNGAAGYVLKRAGGDEVANAIRAIYNGNVYLGTEVTTSVVEIFVQQREQQETSAIYDVLTDREREVLILVAEGHTTREIAELLSISAKTVNAHRISISRKLGTQSQADMVKYAIREGLVSLDH